MRFAVPGFLFLLATLVSTASADTAFWWTCDFDGGAGIQPKSFGFFPSDMTGTIVLGEEERPIAVYELGGVANIFLTDMSPERWVMAFDPETNSAIGYADAHLVPSISCRGGAE